MMEEQPLSKLQRDSGQREERVLMAKRKGLVLDGHQFGLLEGDWPQGPGRHVTLVMVVR